MVVEAASRAAASPGVWPALPPVSIDGLATALPANRVLGSDVLRLITQLWPRLERRVSLFADELAETQRFLVRPIEEALVPLSPGEQAVRYAATATPLALAAAEHALQDAAASVDEIGLLVVCSCTGFVLPGVDVQLVDHLGLRRDIRRMPFMNFGCAGGAASLAWATDWVRSHPGQSALVVAVEVPSLTFRPADTSADNLLSVLVFGDGAGAALLRGDAVPGRIGIGRTASRLVASSTEALGFERADDGFRVVVSRQLPRLLETNLPALVDGFIGGAGDLDAVAAHPGGQAIVDSVVRCLDLGENQVAATRNVLRRTGNTSSAGILFVLEELAANLPHPTGRGVAAAFGPGLMVELLELLWAA
ncbi:MAG: 3-oxoacyl-[acyl-carrier-protein] synthase III C-terminal domain-containing protein [Candidatus Dormiibacterota bacterium]